MGVDWELNSLRPTFQVATLTLPSWVDSVEKGSDVLGFGSLLEHLRDSIGLFTYSFGCGVPPLMRRGHHNPSCKTGHRFVRSRPPDVLCQRLQVLRNGCEVELVARTGESSQAHAFEPMVGLQVRKAHLNLLALVT